MALIFLQEKGETNMNYTKEQFTNGADYSLAKPYANARTQQLADKTKTELIEMVADLEFKLLVYLDGVFDENLKDITPDFAYQNLTSIDQQGIALLTALDKDNDFVGLTNYIAE